MKQLILLFKVIIVFVYCDLYAQSSVDIGHDINRIGMVGDHHGILKSNSLSSSQYIDKINCDPYVVRNEGEFRVICEVKQSTIESITLNAPFMFNQDYEELTLYDDGLNGDALKDDNIFTSSSLYFTDSPITGKVSESTIRSADVTYVFDNGASFTENIDLGFGIRGILDDVQLPEVNIINDSFQISSHVVNIVEEWDWDLIWNSLYIWYPTQAYFTYYDYFRDDRDFLILSTTYPTPFGPAATYGKLHENHPLWDYGLNRLKGIVNVSGTRGAVPSILNHELLHNWALHLPDELHLSYGPHYGAVEVPSSGFGGARIGDSLVQFNTVYRLFQTDSFTKHYNELEYFLMGLLPFDSITMFPIKALVNWEYLGQNNDGLQEWFEFSADSMMYVTKELFSEYVDIDEYYSPESQNEFSIAQIVVSDRLLTPLEMAFYHEQIVNYEKKDIKESPDLYFYAASYGRATITSKLSTLTYSRNNDDSVPLERIKVYPNPTRSIINIENEGMHKFHFDLLDISGQFLIKGEGTSDNYQMDLSQYEDGVYILRIKSNEGIYTSRIVKF